MLRRLDLAYNSIAKIDTGAFSGVLNTLQELDLTGNRVDVFPARPLAGAVRLESLDLQGDSLWRLKLYSWFLVMLCPVDN